MTERLVAAAKAGHALPSPAVKHLGKPIVILPSSCSNLGLADSSQDSIETPFLSR